MTSKPRRGRHISESSLDVLIPSYPGSPRSLRRGSLTSSLSSELISKLRQADEFLHADSPFLIAAETGDDKVLEILIQKKTDVQQMDHLGRTALHLAVCSGNERAIRLLLAAGINTNVKDNVGMTPLSLCLMRRPLISIVNLLFEHGAVLMPRASSVDTGLFLQFVMMCTPSREDEKILRYLVNKGALVDDPEAPGGRQALHFAAMSNNCELINILVDLGADLYLTNHRDETPKEFALSFQCKEAAALLEILENVQRPGEFISMASKSVGTPANILSNAGG